MRDANGCTVKDVPWQWEDHTRGNPAQNNQDNPEVSIFNFVAHLTPSSQPLVSTQWMNTGNIQRVKEPCELEQSLSALRLGWGQCGKTTRKLLFTLCMCKTTWLDSGRDQGDQHNGMDLLGLCSVRFRPLIAGCEIALAGFHRKTQYLSKKKKKKTRQNVQQSQLSTLLLHQKNTATVAAKFSH